jgi:hypothetical protein
MPKSISTGYVKSLIVVSVTTYLVLMESEFLPYNISIVIGTDSF